MTTAMLPARYRVTARHAETSNTVTLALQPVDTPIATCRPGQFTMLYAFGIGEVPISSPDRGVLRRISALLAERLADRRGPEARGG